MNEQQKKHISKFISLILRHKPETIELELDENGWADVEALIAQSSKHNVHFTKEELETIVATNDKKRFLFNEPHTRIRANQGHSVNISLDIPAKVPPAYLYHGTIEKFLPAIKTEGLHKMSRQHVHLSHKIGTAQKVGSRRGKPIILSIRSGEMHEDGILFYCSENGVWLTDQVPVKYINFNTPQ